MKITKRQLSRLISEVMGDDLIGGPFEFTEPDAVQDGDAHPHIVSIRMVEALRPVIESGNVEASLEALDALWDHLRNTSPVPTNDVPENAPEDEEDPIGDDLYGTYSDDDIEWMEERFHQDQEGWVPEDLSEIRIQGGNIPTPRLEKQPWWGELELIIKELETLSVSK